MIQKKDNKIPIGIYLHFPYCKNICSYCDFVVDKNLDQIERYLNALLIEIEETSNKYYDSTKYYINTLYIGGGTPSLLSPSQMSLIINKLNNHLDLSNAIEISMESNPASLGLQKMKEYKSIGINRISIGVQSFIKKELGILKRNHSPNSAIKSIYEAKEVGFNSVNFDLIYSIPNQINKDWISNLEKALELEPDHLSCYNLTYEVGTPLYTKLKSGLITKNNEELDANIFLQTSELLEENAYKHYEVSNYSKVNHECLHNLEIWRNGEYLGFGVGAHWYINGIRYENSKSINDYLTKIEKGIEISRNVKTLNENDKFEEYIILGLRAEGINLNTLKEKYKINHNILDSYIVKKMIAENYIKINKLNIKLTKIGYLLADSITYEFIKLLIVQK